MSASLSYRLLIGSIVICALLLLVHYFYLGAQLFPYPLAYSYGEALNIYKAFAQLPGAGNGELWYTPCLSFLYHFLHLENTLGIWRALNYLALLGIGATLVILLLKDRISPWYALIAFLILVSLPLTQKLSFQVLPDLWALFFGALGISLYFNFKPKVSWWGSGLATICFVIAALFSLKLVFWSFFFLLFFHNLEREPRLALLFFSVPIALILWAMLSTGQLQTVFTSWRWDYFCSNTSPLLRSWSLFALLLTLLPLTPFSLINLKHPASLLFMSSLGLNLWDSGSQLQAAGGWLVTVFAVCWVAALLLKYLCENRRNLFLQDSLLILLIFSGALNMLMLPAKLQNLLDNASLLRQTKSWIYETRTRLQPDEQILAQDTLFHLFFNQKRPVQTPSTKEIAEQRFKYILLAENPELYWPKELLEEVYIYYLPIRKVLVFTEEGLMFIRKGHHLDGENRSTKSELNELPVEELFVTWQPR